MHPGNQRSHEGALQFQLPRLYELARVVNQPGDSPYGVVLGELPVVAAPGATDLVVIPSDEW